MEGRAFIEKYECYVVFFAFVVMYLLAYIFWLACGRDCL